MTSQLHDYYRRDQLAGVTAPDLSKDCSYAEHIVRARGKRTQLTSVSREPDRIRDFGPVLYQVIQNQIHVGGHSLLEHAELMQELRRAAETNDKAERIRAVQAQRYAKRRVEGLIKWSFNTSGVDRNDLITWAFVRIQKCFRRV
jgi:hypothetical protein